MMELSPRNRLAGKKHRRLVVAVMLMSSAGATAVTLTEAYETALSKDRIYGVNSYDNESAKENVVIDRASTRPTATGST